MNTALKNRLTALWTIVLVFCISTGAVLVWLEDRTYQEELDKTRSETMRANRAFVEHTEHVISHVDTLLRAVRAYHRLSRTVDDTSRFIAGLNSEKAFVENIYLLDGQGDIVIPMADRSKRINAKSRDYFRFHAETPEDRIFITPVGQGQVTGKQQFRVSRRIDRADGSFAGVILVPVEPIELTRYYERLLPNPENTATLIGTLDHRIRARSPAPSVEVWQRQIASPLWEALSKEARGTYRSTSSVDQIAREFAYERVADLPLVMLTGFSSHDVKQRVTTQMRPVQLIAASVIVFVLMLAYVLSIILKQREAMRDLATTDGLTGLANHRQLMRIGPDEVARAQRYEKPLSLIMLDVDHFKRTNDTWGHPTGDRVLQRLAATVRSMIRKQDSAGRFGGEEFVLILPETDLAGARVIAERIRETVAADTSVASADGHVVRTTVSLGVATLDSGDTTFETLLGNADKALYRAKEGGRNRVLSA